MSAESRQASSTRTEVFSINFLRHETFSQKIKRGLAYFSVGFLALNLIVLIVFLSWTFQTYYQAHLRLERLTSGTSSEATFGSLQSRTEAIYQQAVHDLTRINSILEIRREGLSLADKLAALARTLPERTWITEINFDRSSRSLSVQAMSWMQTDTLTESPLKEWLQALKADPDFGKGLQKIGLVKTLQRRKEKIELYTFEFVAEWGK